MLHSIDSQGNIAWHCPSAKCSHHNCSNWDRGIQCPHHTSRQVTGSTHTTHISDPGIIWTDNATIALPRCDECGSQIFLRVHRDDELVEPIIKRDELTGKILQVTMPEGSEHLGNLWFKDADVVRRAIPHPTLAHLKPQEIKAMQESIHSQAPDAPVDWMMTTQLVEDIHDVVQHPAVARHRELARQLKEIGNVYDPTKA